MMSGRRLRLLLRLAPTLALLAGIACAEPVDPPARVARINDIEGSVTWAPAGDNEWRDAPVNRPLTRGDRLWSDRGTRAEFQVGSSAVRLDGRTRLDIIALDDQSARFSLTGGSVYVRVRDLPEGENFEIDTPNLALRAGGPGDYRIDVDADQGTTRVTIHAGSGTVYGENGQPLPLGGGQQITFRGRALAQVNAQESPPDDAFDRWAMERNRHADQSVAARYVPREVVGYEQLDPYGQWRRNETYGAIWVPEGLPTGWAPYRQGRWDWIEPWGWTWIDDAPWGFAPFHYGRWALVDGQWAWVPGRLSVHPVYAPALVAFVGGSTSEIAW
ncbi:MAG TPA: FecR family protein, partial [Ramlibacter sp.]|nr:FecR family protein [Ramlibacter sp.]